MENKTIIGWAILTLLIPLGGFIGGFYYLFKGRTGEGFALLLMSVIIWFIYFLMLL